MNIDDLRAKADAAKAWRPEPFCRHRRETRPSGYDITFVELVTCNNCEACLGSRRAVEDVAEHVEFAVIQAENWSHNHDKRFRGYALDEADNASRIASYFCSEPNPVSIFRDAVKELCK